MSWQSLEGAARQRSPPSSHFMSDQLFTLCPLTLLLRSCSCFRLTFAGSRTALICQFRNPIVSWGLSFTFCGRCRCWKLFHDAPYISFHVKSVNLSPTTDLSHLSEAAVVERKTECFSTDLLLKLFASAAFVVFPQYITTFYFMTLFCCSILCVYHISASPPSLS